MARRKLTEEEKIAQQKEKALAREYEDIIKRLRLIPSPTYSFNIGDKVKIGRYVDATIIEKHEDGKFYKIEYSVEHTNYGRPYIETGLLRYIIWLDVRPMSHTTESFIRNDDMRVDFVSTGIGNLLSKAYHFGTDMNPDYQRCYVWNEDDKVKLIDSIFHNVDIGKFCFVHRGYGADCMYEVVDGKQRMRTILDFYENRFAYKGKYFNDLCARDQSWFENYTISMAELRKADKKSILKYFILLNRTGKVMEESQLNKVENMLGEIENNEADKHKDHHCMCCGEYIEEEHLRVCDKCASEFKI